MKISMPATLTTHTLLKSAGTEQIPGQRISQKLKKTGFPENLFNALRVLPAVSCDLIVPSNNDSYLKMVDKLEYQFIPIKVGQCLSGIIKININFNENARKFAKAECSLLPSFIKLNTRNGEVEIYGHPLKNNLLIIGNIDDIGMLNKPVEFGENNYAAVFAILKSYIEILESNLASIKFRIDKNSNLLNFSFWIGNFNKLAESILGDLE